MTRTGASPVRTMAPSVALSHFSPPSLQTSNHGGRQLNGALATIDALPEVVQAVRSQEKKIPVHVDGGIRHGTDVFKALALGADFVWIGRPILWGLAYKGQEGVELALQLIRDEFKKVQASIQGDAVRVSSKTKDDLQTVMQRLKEDDWPVALQFTNYR